MVKLFLFVSFIFICSNLLFGQNDSRLDSINKFNQQNDALFLEKKYTTIIENCKEVANNVFLKNSAELYLIPAYFMMGDTSASDKILTKIIDKAFDENRDGKARTSCVSLMNSNSEGMHHFLNNSYNREKVITSIVSNYEKETLSHKKTGSQLVRCILNDQFIRGKSQYTTDSFMKIIPGIKREQTISTFLFEDSINRRKVFEIYKKSKRFFSPSEIGSVYWYQFLLFAHEPDLKRRAYYFDLLKKGLKKGTADNSDIITFILRTEAQKLGWEQFNKVRDKRIEELKKVYKVPNYRYRLY